MRKLVLTVEVAVMTEEDPAEIRELIRRSIEWSATRERIMSVTSRVIETNMNLGDYAPL